MDTPVAPDEGDRSPIPVDEDSDRWRAAKYTLPFVALGIADVILVIGWGLNPIWGFAILPPILFMSVLTWVAFKSGFVTDREDY
ncbi:hypothetical protein HAPAU_03690 [Halalkalicoccus paucihalophilus]|jgi:cobalamin synthase|uniref:DUF8142 domain-containing protein n=1 Tax=Halalkalicoccus paucihalophilus TaxID=1008153 RepID=A0A151AJ93_9EURY|nr:hypothetical protein [Halalkalicoccus paucihalophilus]KYH27701.1 hypothetical protein HAPAU_03690 [Halalkalicoccus paucihalophilus]MCL7419126.1 hypothetical protein [Halalkalicoccus sp.]